MTTASTSAAGITVPVALVVLAMAVVLAAALAAAVVEARRRRQVRTLLVRLGELEDRLDDGAVDTSSQITGIPSASTDADADGSSSDPLSGMTTHVQRLVGGGSDFEAATLADQAIAVVHRHMEESFSPGALADELNVSIRTLERGLAHALRCTPGQLITAMKMREARHMLASGRYRVTEVAVRLAFSSPQYFSRRFKAFYGHSPSHFSRER